MYILRLISKTYYFYVLLRQKYLDRNIIYYFFRNNNNGRHISYKVMNSLAFYGTFSIFEDENCIDSGLDRNRYSSTYITEVVLTLHSFSLYMTFRKITSLLVKFTLYTEKNSEK